MGILVPGQNCMRLAHASRASVLVDGERYFSTFKRACELARSQIIIVGWDLDYHTPLHPGVLGPFLKQQLAAKRDLRICLLTWDYSAVYVRERGLWSTRARPWQGRARMQMCLDDAHPFGSSQHQKLVVIDDELAFCGGIDLCQARWDTPDHRANDAERRLHTGEPYEAFHDVQMLVQGEAARALSEVAKDRWYNATGKRLRTKQHALEWPLEDADFRDVEVGVSRTLPAFGKQKQVCEVQQLYVDAIAKAKRFVYCENQYLTSGAVADALCSSLKRDEGPQIAILGPAEPSGWLEQSTMGTLRANLIGRLRAADAHGRLRLYYPVNGEQALNLHSKVMIVDDAFLRVGSSNLSNRSMGLDSECDLAIEADASAIRARLLGEHLGAEIAVQMPLFAAIDAAGTQTRTLVRVPDPEPALLASIMPEETFFDSERPAEPARAIDAVIRGENDPVDRRPFMYASAMLTLLVLLALAWRFTPLARWIEPAHLATVAEALRAKPLALLWLTGAFALASFALVPITLLLIQASVILGAKTGIAIGFAGVFVSASAGFALGRVASRRALVRLAGSRWRRLEALFKRNAVLSVAIVRAFPIAPFTLINVVAGASPCRYPAFIIGSLLGMAPGIVALSFFGRGVYDLIVAPNWSDAVVVVVVIAFVFGSGLVLRGRLHARDAAHR